MEAARRRRRVPRTLPTPAHRAREELVGSCGGPRHQRGSGQSRPRSLAASTPRGSADPRCARPLSVRKEGPYPCAACPAARQAFPSEGCGRSRCPCSIVGSKTLTRPLRKDHRAAAPIPRRHRPPPLLPAPPRLASALASVRAPAVAGSARYGDTPGREAQRRLRFCETEKARAAGRGLGVGGAGDGRD